MDIPALNFILWPIKWVVEFLLVSWHALFTLVGINPDSGLSWVLSIAGLVIVIRAALIPIFVRQIKSQRRMLEVAPLLKKIQDKYKGKRDQLSREAMSRETMAMYKSSGTNPLASCLPLLIQMPIFFSLFMVLSTAQGYGVNHHAGVGLLGPELSKSFGSASLFGLAPLNESFSTGVGLVKWIAIIMVVLMTASQFITQLQIMSKNQSAAMKESPTYKQQRILLYVLPFVFLFSGFTFPLGVMFYWLISNFWTMGQQFLVIRNLPTPGSEAELARESRIAKKAQRKRGFTMVEDAPNSAVVEPRAVQRAQPVNPKNRKKSGKK